MNKTEPKNTVTRGPIDHQRREQIIKVADEYFRHYGYNKTSMADLAREIGVSSTYLYKFFDSKQAIGEAICSMILTDIHLALQEIADSDTPASLRLNKLFNCAVEKSLTLYFNERRTHEIVLVSTQSKWNSIDNHRQAVFNIIKKVITDGQNSGEFEQNTPIDEICLAILETLLPFTHPMLLGERDQEEHKKSAIIVANMVLRSLRKS